MLEMNYVRPEIPQYFQKYPAYFQPAQKVEFSWQHEPVYTETVRHSLDLEQSPAGPAAWPDREYRDGMASRYTFGQRIRIDGYPGAILRIKPVYDL